mmetsp:Transcript_39997/g.48758  ORF Transcript_39997/g.48758 Transcript_39997/m.48758 type:complete len:222 (+) Transcript_39997:392-1057(+)
MRRSIQISVTTNNKGLVRIQLHQPISDQGRFRKQITSCCIGKFINGRGVCLNNFLERKCDTSGGSFGGFNKSFPNIGPVKINCDNVCTERKQDLERPHGRTSTQKYKVFLSHFCQPFRMINAFTNCLSRTGFNSSIRHPLLHLRLQLLPTQIPSFIRHGKRRLRPTSATLPLDKTSLKFVRVACCHSLLQTNTAPIRTHKLEYLMRAFQTSCRHIQRRLGR